MDTLSRKCMDRDTISSFCDCIGREEPVNTTAQSFCTRAKADPTVSEKDLIALKMALLDQAEDSCCDC
jgi:hypothetical protein